MEQIWRLDGDILLWIQNYLRNDMLTPVFKLITILGNAGFIWILITCILVIYKKTRQSGIVTAVSLAITFLVNNLVIKNLFHRTRPYEVLDGLQILIEKQSDFSFPSGHTAAAFGTAAAVYLLFPKKYGVPALAFAFLMGFSRLYVGVHYPTDVIGGALAGTAVALGTVLGYRKWSDSKSEEKVHSK